MLYNNLTRDTSEPVNLLLDPIFAVYRLGSAATENVAVWQISDKFEELPIVLVHSERPDFRAAIIQFMLSVLQTCCPPRNGLEWRRWWVSPPSPEELRERFLPFAESFEFRSDGPSFMEDFDLGLKGAVNPVGALLPESPGKNTAECNTDHFIKAGKISELCERCAALALYSLQVNAPAGGQGHRVGIRGGGPLTTFLLPPENKNTLWHMLWLNVFREEPSSLPVAFPWMSKTFTSESDREVFPEPDRRMEASALWAMPRRMRLIRVVSDNETVCQVCSAKSEVIVRNFKTKGFGPKYSIKWRHPYSPYRTDKKKQESFPLKGRVGRLSFRDWLGITMGEISEQKSISPAACVYSLYQDGKVDAVDSPFLRIWAFGFDFDNMKARCWYDHEMPLLAKIHQGEFFTEGVKKLLSVFDEVLSNLSKSAAGILGTSERVGSELVSVSEPLFYRTLEQINRPTEDHKAFNDSLERWAEELLSESEKIFDARVVSLSFGGSRDGKVVKARNAFRRKNFKIRKDLKKEMGRA
jgi:CRISPR system Cascade subunit CasA